MLAGRNATGTSANRFRFALYYKARGWLSWPDLGTMTFNSKPACSNLNDVNMVGSDATWNGRVAIFGKSSSDNRFYARVMLLNAAGQINEPPQSPTVSVDWHSVGLTAYDSAPFATVEYGYLILGGRTSNGTINVYLNQLAQDPSSPRTYSKTAWRASIALSALPSGWTAFGDQAAASTEGGLTYVVTRARNALNQTRLYYIPLYVPFAGSNGYFLGPPSWVQIPTGTVPISSDPAIEYDYNRSELTVYFRGGAGSAANRIFQSTSVDGGNTWETFTAIGTDTFTTAPAAAGTLQFDWSHAVLARKSTDSTQLWWNGIDPRAFDP